MLHQIYKYKDYLNYNIYSHCIELSCDKKEGLEKCIKSLNESDYYYNKIADEIMQNKTNESFTYEVMFPIYWNIVIFIVKTEWVDEYDRGEEISGIFHNFENAKQCFDSIIKKDQKENSIHKKAIKKGEESGYVIDKSDDTYSLFEEGNYNNYHFNVGIYKQYLK